MRPGASLTWVFLAPMAVMQALHRRGIRQFNTDRKDRPAN
jgi:predicted N-acetyltransferase YhbS